LATSEPLPQLLKFVLDSRSMEKCLCTPPDARERGRTAGFEFCGGLRDLRGFGERISQNLNQSCE
jgi:hypothetical protein